MRLDILTLFPEVILGFINSSIIKRALDEEKVMINVINFRDFSLDKNKKVDDYSYGGGAGMIIGLSSIVSCLRSIDNYQNAYKIITKPTGEVYNQEKAKLLSKEKHLIIICGHYEGIDERITNFVDEEISIGDYILTGGEIASCAIIDSVIRLLPKVLNNENSTEIESFNNYLLEYPQYTRPQIFEGLEVPKVLLSGNHEKINNYRIYKQIEVTYKKRKDLLDKAILTKKEKEYLDKVIKGEEFDEN